MKVLEKPPATIKLPRQFVEAGTNGRKYVFHLIVRLHDVQRCGKEDSLPDSGVVEFLKISYSQSMS